MPISIFSSPVAYCKAQLGQAELAENFVQHFQLFTSRNLLDCRPVDPSGGRVPHEFLVGAPGYRRLQYGTASEYDRGLVYSKVNIRDFSAGFAAEPTVVPGDVYDWQNAHVSISTASRVAIVKGHPSEEAAVFFFPLESLSTYLIVEVGGRYGERVYYFFEGDPDDLLRGRGRNPRHAELLKFKSIREVILDWPEFHYVPVELIAVTPGSTNARAPHLHEVTNATATLIALGHLGGQ